MGEKGCSGFLLEQKKMTLFFVPKWTALAAIPLI
uniref:Uncharacterized protein n=1 Tax=Klebsiella pneumoniae TaxID=573 RepID=A0A486R6H0_KLEPN|nr:Uncharacterised protein [Klebsiella pneumoniae]VGM30041.1 Uncharacterised protein [Klebsiella pneumoniae]